MLFFPMGSFWSTNCFPSSNDKLTHETYSLLPVTRERHHLPNAVCKLLCINAVNTGSFVWRLSFYPNICFFFPIMKPPQKFENGII